MTTKASAYPCSRVPAYSRVVGDRLWLISIEKNDSLENNFLNNYSSSVGYSVSETLIIFGHRLIELFNFFILQFDIKQHIGVSA